MVYGTNNDANISSGKNTIYTPIHNDDRWNVESWLKKEQGGNADSCPVLRGTVPTE